MREVRAECHGIIIFLSEFGKIVLGKRLKHHYLSYIFHTLANFNKLNA